MVENTNIYNQCEFAFKSILEACENGKNSEPIAKSKDGKYIFYKLENGLYLWNLVKSFESSIDIITKCNPTNIESAQDVYPAIFKYTNDGYDYNDGDIRRESIRFEIYQNFQNSDFSSWASIRSEKKIEYNPYAHNIDDMYKIEIIDRACLPVQPNTPEDLLECLPDVKQLLLQAKEKSSDEKIIRVYDEAIRLYDMFIDFSNDVSLKHEEEINLARFFRYGSAAQYLEIGKGKVIPELQDLSKIIEIIYNQRDLNSNIDRYHLKIEIEKKQEEEKKAEEEKRKEREAKKNQQRKNYLGLINKAEKLGKGEMTLEDYIKCSKTSIDDLINFAKKEHMDADVIRGLYKYKKPYALYKKPFSKKQYLESTILLIDGQEVKPTEEDVDKCVEYLTAMGSLVCDKIVKDTVRKYLKGEIDITLKTAELQEQIEENKSTIAKNEEEIKDTLTEVVLSQQNRIKAQENEIADLKSQRRSLNEK